MVPPWVCRSVRAIRPFAIASWAFGLVVLPFSTNGLAETAERDESGVAEPVMLDLSKKVHARIATETDIASVGGKQEFESLPFQIDGVIRLYGRTPETNQQNVFPDSVSGIDVGRKFKELHLVHYAMWPDVDGDAVAYVCLDYADDTKFTFPIRYGVHVLDWSDLPSYEAESLSDPYTTICWRHPPRRYNAPLRLFMSTFANPFPDKEVRSIDVASARNLASYCLLAATVSNSKTIPEPELPAKKGFDAKIAIRVEDEKGVPIEGALILPSMIMEDVNLVASPFRTSPTGEGVIPYPTKTTRSIYVQVSKQGFDEAYENWEVPAPKESTIQLRRSDHK